MSLQTRVKPMAKAIIIQENNSYDLIIIGGGPAGLTAAIYALRSKLRTLLIEKMVLGGMASTTSHIDNYPGFPAGVTGMDLTQKMAEQAAKLGLEIIYGGVSQISLAGKAREVRVEGKVYSAKALIIASGTEARKLGIPGEETFLGRGVSYCATCDGPLFRDKHVVVVGGGDTAVGDAIFLTKFAGKVTIVHRRGMLRAARILQERARASEKIEFQLKSVVAEVTGADRVEGVKVKDVDTGAEKTIKADGVFVLIGLKPNSDAFKDALKLDENGYIISDDGMKTSVEGIFACGDVRKKPLRQVATAVGEGATAAVSAGHYVDTLKGAEYK